MEVAILKTSETKALHCVEFIEFQNAISIPTMEIKRSKAYILKSSHHIS